MANPIVTIHMDDDKDIKLELYPEIAPITVENHSRQQVAVAC